MNNTGQTYTGGMLEAFGVYSERLTEYRFAVEKVFHHGLFRHNSPVLDVGCGDPYEALLRFLRDFAWDGQYVGIDFGFEPNVLQNVVDDDSVTLLSRTIDGVALPFPPTEGHPFKQFATAFVLEIIDKIEEPDILISELQRTCASIIVIGPNDLFEGWRQDDPTRKRTIDIAWLRDRGFQKTGYVNLNGRLRPRGELYSFDNGIPKNSSEVWGVWCDERAAHLNRDRTAAGYELKLGEGGDVVQARLTGDDARDVPGVTI